MEYRPIEQVDPDRFIDELWMPFAREMAALDDRNALTENAADHAHRHFISQFEDSAVWGRIAVEDESLLGYATAEPDDQPPIFERGPVLVVNQLYVAGPHRRQGIARRLIELADEAARARGCDRLVLSVNADNEAALAFYEDRAFDRWRYKLSRPVDPDYRT